MSNFPCEVLDHIVDLLHGSQIPLRNCCLVSKSWIPRTRRHLFAEVDFSTAKSLQSWRKTFPDPSTSPARYTKHLFIGCPQEVAAADAEADGWIPSFSRVEHLRLGSWDVITDRWRATFVLLRTFSPVVKSLNAEFYYVSFWHFFDLAFSFPLLEDLAVCGHHDVPANNDGDSDGSSAIDQPSSPPVLTGTLELYSSSGMVPIIHRLLFLPSGIHFRKLIQKWFREGDIPLTMTLVQKCSHTLESLDITCNTAFRTSIGPLRPHGSDFFFCW